VKKEEGGKDMERTEKVASILVMVLLTVLMVPSVFAVTRIDAVGGLSSGSNLSATTNVTFDIYSDVANANITLFRNKTDSSDGIPTVAFCYNTTRGGSPASFFNTTCGFTDVQFGDGVFTIVASANYSGGGAENSTPFILGIDTVTPTITSISHTDNIQESSTQRIYIVPSDTNMSVANCTLTFTGNSSVATAEAQSAVNFTYDKVPAGKGPVEYTVTCTDYGNHAVTSGAQVFRTVLPGVLEEEFVTSTGQPSIIQTARGGLDRTTLLVILLVFGGLGVLAAAGKIASLMKR
jgi:hypothetical protein